MAPAAEPADAGATYFGTPVSDIQSNVAVSGHNITGTLKYLSTGSLVDTWGAGNFLALKFPDADITNYTVKVGLDPSQGSGLVELDSDKDGVFKITNKNTQKFIIQVTKDGETVTQRYNLSGLTVLNS